MKYLCLIYNEERHLAAMPPAAVEAIAGERVAYDATLTRAGQFVACERLQPTRTAATVRFRDGKATVTDGPFAETKEQLGGYYMVDCANLDAAIEWAAKIPGARYGSVEVRPIMEFN